MKRCPKLQLGQVEVNQILLKFIRHLPEVISSDYS